MARLSFSRVKGLTYGCQFETLNRGFTGNLATEMGKLIETLSTGDKMDDIQMNKYFLTLKGLPNAKFKEAVALSEKLKRNKEFKELLKFTKQVRCETVIAGTEYLGFADFYDESTKTVWDLKTVKDFSVQWSDEHSCKLPFHANSKYALQGAVYLKALEAEEFKIIAISKKSGEIRIYEYMDHVIEDAMETLIEITPAAADILDFKVGPKRCEMCPSCISSRTKTLREVVDC